MLVNFHIKLKSKEHEFLNNLTKTGNRNSREFERAYMLLTLNKGKKREKIPEFYYVSRIMIWRVKDKYVVASVEDAIKDEPRTGRPKKYDDTHRAEIIAMACSKVPEGKSRWTIRLLEKKLKGRRGMTTINRELIRSF